MGALKCAATAMALALSVAAGPGFAREDAAWRIHVGEAAARFGLPEAWVLRVIAAESGGRTHLGGKPITSHAGAMGLMQVMPATWAALRARYRLGTDPHDPRDNIVAGTAYLRDMYDRFGYPGLFAAYNAGPGRYGDYLSRGRPLPRETRDYVAKITGGAPAPRFAIARQTAMRAKEAPAGDQIFLSLARASAAPLAPAPTAGAERRETAPIGRAHDEEGAHDSPGGSLFLLRKSGPGGGG